MANITGLKYERDFVINRLKATLDQYEAEVKKREDAEEAHRKAMEAWLTKVLASNKPVSLRESYNGVHVEFSEKALKGKPVLKKEERTDDGRWPATHWQAKDIRETLAKIENSINETFTLSSLRVVEQWLM